jgi:hypothetical protein
VGVKRERGEGERERRGGRDEEKGRKGGREGGRQRGREGERNTSTVDESPPSSDVVCIYYISYNIL